MKPIAKNIVILVVAILLFMLIIKPSQSTVIVPVEKPVSCWEVCGPMGCSIVCN